MTVLIAGDDCQRRGHVCIQAGWNEFYMVVGL